MFERILVPYDGTSFSLQAIQVAHRLVAPGGTLLLAHVHELAPLTEMDALAPADPAVERARIASEGSALDRIADELRERGTTVETMLLEGEVADALQSLAVERRAGLLVMASHDRGRLGRFFMGSDSERTARHQGVPVLVLRGRELPADGSVAPAFRRILVPLDGTPHAEAILEPALGVARADGASLTLVIVRDPLLAAAALAEPADEAMEYLAGLAGRVTREGMAVETREVADRRSAHGIVQAAEDAGADLIAMSTHGRGVLARLAQGSVAAQVMHATTLPMLLLHPTIAEGADGGAD